MERLAGMVMKIVIAPDSFKGSLSALEASEAIERGLRRVRPDIDTVIVPMADGGEGTVDALVAANKGRVREVEVCGPLAGMKVGASYGILPDGTAVIEMAAAAGLPLLKDEHRNPFETTSYGVGELIIDAVVQGCRQFIVGIGGSATNDCGTGLVQALGVRFYDDTDKEFVEPMNCRLNGLVKNIDVAGLHPMLAECEFTVACDVENPLLGARGATYVYSPQKGARKEDLPVLESNMSHVARIIQPYAEVDLASYPGLGASGGLAVTMLTFLRAKLGAGIKIVIEQSNFAERIAGADLIITGEGRVDGQTVYGKTIAGIAAAAGEKSVPVVAMAGCLGEGAAEVLGIGVGAVVPICSGPMTLAEAMANAPELLSDAAERVFRLILLGGPKQGVTAVKNVHIM